MIENRKQIYQGILKDKVAKKENQEDSPVMNSSNTRHEQGFVLVQNRDTVVDMGMAVPAYFFTLLEE